MKEQLEQVKIFNATPSFKIQKYYENEPKFNGVYSRNNLCKTKNGTYIINLDEYKSIGTHWIALYVNDNNVTHSIQRGMNLPLENYPTPHRASPLENEIFLTSLLYGKPTLKMKIFWPLISAILQISDFCQPPYHYVGFCRS